MIRHDDLEPPRPSGGDLVHGGDPAVHGEHEPDALVGESLEGVARDTVAFLEPARKMPIDVRAELAEEGARRARSHRCRRRRSRRARRCVPLHSRSDPFHGGCHVAEGRDRAGELGIQETPRVARIVVAAAHEHGRCDVADAEFARERSRRFGVERGDRPGTRHAKDGTGATGQS